MVGLARALLARGVPTVVVALWSLPDSSTSTLMRTFYEVLCGGESADVGEAMGEAMRRTRDATPGEAHWGGLMVLGCGGVMLGGTSAGVSEAVPPKRPQALQPKSEPEPQPEPLDMDVGAWLASHGAARYEAAFREEEVGCRSCPTPVSYTHLTLPTICSV